MATGRKNTEPSRQPLRPAPASAAHLVSSPRRGPPDDGRVRNPIAELDAAIAHINRHGLRIPKLPPDVRDLYAVFPPYPIALDLLEEEKRRKPDATYREIVDAHGTEPSGCKTVLFRSLNGTGRAEWSQAEDIPGPDLRDWVRAIHHSLIADWVKRHVDPITARNRLAQRYAPRWRVRQAPGEEDGERLRRILLGRAARAGLSYDEQKASVLEAGIALATHDWHQPRRIRFGSSGQGSRLRPGWLPVPSEAELVDRYLFQQSKKAAIALLLDRPYPPEQRRDALSHRLPPAISLGRVAEVGRGDTDLLTELAERAEAVRLVHRIGTLASPAERRLVGAIARVLAVHPDLDRSEVLSAAAGQAFPRSVNPRNATWKLLKTLRDRVGNDER